MGKQKVRLLYLGLIIIILAAFLFAEFSLTGCKKGTSTSKQETIELVFSHLVPEMATTAQVAKAWGDKIEEMSGGRVKFTYYWGASLTPPGETYKGYQTGVADVGFYPPELAYQPLSYGMQLPLLGIPSMKAGSEIYAKLLDEFPEMRAEFEGVKVFAPRMAAPTHLHFTKKDVRTPADVKGLKIRVAQDVSIANFLQAAGATPVEVVPPELYLSLEKGMVDGVYFSFPAVNVWGAMPLMKSHTVFGTQGISGDNLDVLVFCEATWKRLPDDIKKIIEDLEPWYLEEMIKAEQNEIDKAVALAQSEGQTMIYLTDAEIAEWKKYAETVYKTWINDMEAKGKPGRKVYERAVELISQYR